MAIGCMVLAGLLSLYILSARATSARPELHPASPDAAVAPDAVLPPASPRPEPAAAREPADASAAEPLAADHSIDIQVLGPGQEALAGARLSAMTYAGELLAIADTGPDGHARIVVPDATAPVAVDACCVGYAGERVDLASPLANSYRIVLQPAVSIVGRVRCFDGSPPPAVSEVLAWHTATMAMRDARTLLAKEVGLLRTQTGTDGTFRIDGARAGRTYSLLAGCRGWCSTAPTQVAAGAPQLAEITLLPLFGCILEIDADATPTPSGSELMLAGTRRHHEPDDIPELQSVQVPSLASMLAAAEPDGTSPLETGVDDWRRSYRLYAAATHADYIDGLAIEFDIPGYRRDSFAIRLPRYTGAWATHRVLLARTAIGFGSLEIRWPDVLPRSGGGFWDCSLDLILRPKSEPAAALHLVVPRSGPTTRIGGLPLGVYDVRLASRWGFQHPMNRWLEVEIRQEAATLEVPLDRCGGIMIHPIAFDSTRHRRAIAVRLQQRPDNVSVVSLEAPPYHVFAVPPGQHEVSIDLNDDGRIRRVGCGKIDVVAGAWTRVEVAW